MFARTERLTLRPGWPEHARLTDAIAHETVAIGFTRLRWPYAVGDAEAFLAVPVRQLEASRRRGNAASRRVLAKLGFRKVGREAHHSWAHGCEVGCAVLALAIGNGS